MFLDIQTTPRWKALRFDRSACICLAPRGPRHESSMRPQSGCICAGPSEPGWRGRWTLGSPPAPTSRRTSTPALAELRPLPRAVPLRSRHGLRPDAGPARRGRRRAGRSGDAVDRRRRRRVRLPRRQGRPRGAGHRAALPRTCRLKPICTPACRGLCPTCGHEPQHRPVRLPCGRGDRSAAWLRCFSSDRRPRPGSLTMPNPKRRHSKARRDKRRAHDALAQPGTVDLPQLPGAQAPAPGLPALRPLQGPRGRRAAARGLDPPGAAMPLACGRSRRRTRAWACSQRDHHGDRHERPGRVVTNHDLEKLVDTSDEWIPTRTGIRERRIAAAGEAVSKFAAAAVAQALDAGRRGPRGHRPHHLRHRHARTCRSRRPPALLQHELGCKRRRGLRHVGRLLGVHLRAVGRQAVPRDRPLPPRPGHRRRAAEQVPRLDRPHDVRHLRRRRGRRGDERGRAAPRACSPPPCTPTAA